MSDHESPVVGAEHDPFPAWEQTSRLVSHLRWTVETLGLLVDQLAKRIEQQRPGPRGDET